MQKVEEAELRITLENDLKLLQKLQVCITLYYKLSRKSIYYVRGVTLCFFQHDRRCQVIEMNKMEESALEKKVSLRLGLLFQELVRSIIHRA